MYIYWLKQFVNQQYFFNWRFQIMTEEISENGDTLNPQVNKNWVILDTI